MTDAERYAITVRKVHIEGEDLWRATVRELPDVAEFAETRELAISLATDIIESLMEDAKAEGRPFPDPIEDDDEYSGRVTVRLPKSVHRAVAFQANEEGISINSYIISSVSCSVAQRLRPLSMTSSPMNTSRILGFDAGLVSTKAAVAQKVSQIVLAKYQQCKAGQAIPSFLDSDATSAASPYYGIPVQAELTSVVLGTGTSGFYATMHTGVGGRDMQSVRVLPEPHERRRA